MSPVESKRTARTRSMYRYATQYIESHAENAFWRLTVRIQVQIYARLCRLMRISINLRAWCRDLPEP